MSEPKETRVGMAGSYLFVTIGLIVLWLLTPLINGVFIWMLKCSGVDQDLNGIGDMFGSINALFTALTLAAVAVQLWYQKEELELQRTELRQNTEELKNQAKQLEDQAKALRVQALVHVLNAKVDYHRRAFDQYKEEATLTLKSLQVEDNIVLLTSRSSINHLLDEVQKENEQLKERLAIHPNENYYIERQSTYAYLIYTLKGMIDCEDGKRKAAEDLAGLEDELLNN